MIEVRDVSRVYHRGVDVVHALEHVSLTIPAGRFVALMGPSGSGKSTLLNLLAGLDQPDTGEVVVEGQALSGLDEDALAAWRARHVGLIFQFFNLLPVLSAIAPFAWVVADGRVRRVRLSLGRDFGDRVQVTAGLAGGEVVVVGDPPPLRDGQPVTAAGT